MVDCIIIIKTPKNLNFVVSEVRTLHDRKKNSESLNVHS